MVPEGFSTGTRRYIHISESHLLQMTPGFSVTDKSMVCQMEGQFRSVPVALNQYL